MIEIMETWKKTLSTLDINIVSHGGVASNYLVNYLQNKGLRVISDEIYEQTCHYPYKLIPSQPCLYVYGDVPNAILSMHRRDYLTINMNKIRWGLTEHTDRREYFLRRYPDDPIGIKNQIRNFQKTENTVMLQYPYTVQELEDALERLGFSVDLSGFQVETRHSEYHGAIEKDPLFQRIIKPYVNWQPGTQTQ